MHKETRNADRVIIRNGVNVIQGKNSGGLGVSCKFPIEEIEISTLPLNSVKIADFRPQLLYFWKEMFGQENFPTD